MTTRSRILSFGLVAFSLVAVTLAAARAADEAPIPVADVKPAQPLDFGRDVMPIFRQSCVACHNAKTHKGGLTLESPAAIQKGGDTGPAAAPGKGADSLLVLSASHRGDSPMPPKNNKAGATDLTPQQLGTIKLWIDQGMKGAAVDRTGPIEWQPLPAGLNPIQACDVTPDGRFIACTRANQIFVYDAATQALVTRLTDPSLVGATTQNRPGVAHRDLVQSLKFSRDGKLLASGGYREVKIWRRPEPGVKFAWEGAAGAKGVNAVAVSADGKFAALGGEDGVIRVVGAVDGKPLAELKGHTASVTALRFTTDATRLYSGSADKTIRAWSVPDGKPVERIISPQPIAALALLAGDQQLVTGGPGDNLARVWNLPAAPEAVAGIDGPVTATCVAPDGKRFAVAAGAKNTITIFETTTEKKLATLASPTPVRVLSLDSAGQELLAAGDDANVTLWDVAKGKPRLSIPLLAKPVAIALRPDGKHAVTSGPGNSVSVWNLSTPEARPLAKATDAPPTLIIVSDDGRFVAVVADVLGKPAIVVRAVESGAAVQTIGGLTGSPTAVCFSRDDTRLIAGFADKTATAWTIADGKPLGTFKGHAKAITAVVLHPDGAHACSASADGAVKVWKLADGAEEEPLPAHGGAVVAMAFPANQNVLVTASADKTIRTFDALAGTQVRSGDLSAAATAMAFSRDGSLCAVASADMSVKVLKAADGSPVSTIKAGDEVRSLSFNEDANNPRLLVLSARGAATTYNVKDGAPVEVVRASDATFATFGSQSTELIVAGKKEPLTSTATRYVRTLARGAKPVTRLAYGPDGGTVYSAGEDGGIRAFGSDGGDARFAVETGTPVRSFAVSANGQWLAAGYEDKQLKVLNAGNGQPAQWPFAAPFTGPVSAVSFSADGRRLVAAGAAGELFVFTLDGEDVQRRQNATLLEGCTRLADAASALVVVGGETSGDKPKPLTLYAAAGKGLSRVRTSFVRGCAGQNGRVTALAAMPGEPLQFLCGSSDNSARLISATNGQEQRRYDLGVPVMSISVSSDGMHVAAAGGNYARLWKADGQEVAILRGDRDAVAAAETKQRLAEYAESEVNYWRTQVDEGGRRQQAEQQGIARATAAKNDATGALPGKQQKLNERTAARDVAVKKMTDAKTALVAMTTARDDAAKKVVIADGIETDAKLAAQKAQQVEQKADEANNRKAQAARQAKQEHEQAAGEATEKTQSAERAKQEAVAKAAAAEVAAKKGADAKGAAAAKPTDEALKQQAAEAAQAAAEASGQSKDAEAAYVTAQAQATDAAKKAKVAEAAYVVAKKSADATEAAFHAVQAALAANQKAYDAAQKAAEASRQKRNETENAFDQATNTNRESADRAREAKQQFAMADRDVQQATLVIMSSEKGVAAAAESAKKAEADLAAAKVNQQSAEAGVTTAKAEVETARKAATDAEKPIAAVAFTVKGDGVVTAGADGAIRTWSAQTGAPGQARRTEKPGVPVAALATLSDGSILAGSTDGAGRLWTLGGAWTLVRTIGGGDASSPLLDRVAALAFSPDGTTLVTGGGVPSRSGELKVWSVADGKLLKEIVDAHSDTVYGLAFCGDGRFLASGGADKFVKVWNVTPASGGQPYTLRGSFEGHTAHVLDVSMRFDGRTVVSVGMDASFKTWNVATGEQMFNSRPDQFGKLELTSVQHVGFTDAVVLATAEGRLQLVRDTDGGELRRHDVGRDGEKDAPIPFLYSACATPDGALIVVGGDDGVLRLFDREWRSVAELSAAGRTIKP